MLTRRFALFAAQVGLIVAISACASKPTPVSISETISQNPQLTTLSKLIKDAGLTDTLKSAGPFTVFAPTDEAFKAVPAKALEDIAKDPNRLKAVLTYHVVPAKVMASDVKTGATKSVEGTNLALGKAGDFVTIEDAMVQNADIAATNGVIHTIDRVLLPPVRR